GSRSGRPPVRDPGPGVGGDGTAAGPPAAHAAARPGLRGALVRGVRRRARRPVVAAGSRGSGRLL
ncbi:MAG: hypothetical protein AVDCRST_MAG16-961, partial [uncultured Frankineae bacterium]